MDTKPQSRKENIVIQELEKELLIYDLKINKVFSLNETCAIVWAECSGDKSIEDIASILSRRTKGLVNEEVVWLALETLQKENLLANSGAISAKFNGLSRREVIRKVGFATMVAIPTIYTLVAPTAANAQSGGTALCDELNGGLRNPGSTFVLAENRATCLDGGVCASCSGGGACCSGRSGLFRCSPGPTLEVDPETSAPLPSVLCECVCG